jgi:type IV secretion system protein VirB11
MEHEPLGVGPDASINYLIQPLDLFLRDEAVLEVVMNRPGEIFVESVTSGWARHQVAPVDLPYWLGVARALDTYSNPHSRNPLSEANPLLAATLPGGERVQVVIPPAVPQGTISITIRKPSSVVPRLSDIAASGLFKRTAPPRHGQLLDHELTLLELLKCRRHEEFLIEAVRRRLTLAVSGHTGCGKTYFLKALAQEIDPRERIVTIEDTRELLLPAIPNAVHLLYPAAGVQHAGTTLSAQLLLQASLRMRPDRILLSEVRGEECYYFVRAAASGHPGSMTSLHASTPEMAIKQMALMIRQSAAGAGLRFDEIQQLLLMTLDIIVQFGNDGRGRFIQSIAYEPARRLAQQGGDK